MINLESFLQENFSGSQFSFDMHDTEKEQFDSLNFHDGTQKPDFSEYEEWAIEKELELKKTEYQRLREKEYPQIKDLAVALWELVVENRPEDSIKLQEKRTLIKNKYPKGLNA